MPLLNVNLDSAAKAAIDEAALKLLPVIQAADPLVEAAVDKLLAGLKGMLVGRKIVITIE